MTGLVDRLGMIVLRVADPERAHRLSIKAVKAGLPGNRAPPPADSRLAQTVAGLEFANPVGLAAGYDKNAEVPNSMARFGFGFVEVGTVTPRPQKGNARPRLFRLSADHAVINRLGFNNDGHEAVARRLNRRKRTGIVGVNVGANKDSHDFSADYVAGIEKFWRPADYLAINISSPNTPGLRDLQAGDLLADLLARVTEARARMGEQSGLSRPIFAKIAPDLDDNQLDHIARVALDHGLDGLIVSNTTIARDKLRTSKYRDEAGGLSGRPLFERATIVLAKMRQRVGPELALVGVGGIESVETAWAKFEAGADLVQLYTAMIFAGPGLVGDILVGLSARLQSEGLDHISRIRDRRLDDWAAGKP